MAPSIMVASKVVMISPVSFCSNPETAASNQFQNHNQKLNDDMISKAAQKEHKEFCKVLLRVGIKILQFEEDIGAKTPDALFPNNWFCHLPDGRVFIFPMQAENRRREFREEIIHSLRPSEIIDLRYLEKSQDFLEGTGSLVLDHGYKIAYAGLSSRTRPQALKIFSDISGYKVVSFEATDQNSKAIYHTNVMMALSPKNCIINLSSIKNKTEKNNLLNSLEATKRRIIDITHDQMKQFAGNMLFLRGENQHFFWVCSKQAFDSLSQNQKSDLSKEGELLYSPLNVIENFGGGGARCLMAEIFN